MPDITVRFIESDPIVVKFLNAQWPSGGAGMVWRGDYDNAHTYSVKDTVGYLGSTYICTAISLAHLPTDTNYWDKVASKGDTGEGGATGETGLSAYQVAVADGFVGTISEWLASLIGDTGSDGISAYQVALNNGFVGNEAAWLASLIGAQGPVGPDEVTTTTDTDITGLIKGNGSKILQATADTDFLTPGTASSTYVPKTRTVNGRALTSDISVTKGDVGLGSADNTSDANKPISNATQTALDGKVDENIAITPWTGKTKFSVDAKGLILSAEDATTADIDDSTDRRYVTDSELSAIEDLSGINSGDQTASTVAVTPSGNLGSTNVQLGLQELQGDIDSINSALGGLTDAVILKGTWDASAGTFPGSGVAQAGWTYIVSVTGTVDGVTFNQNDRILAVLDNASTSVFAANWFKLDYTDQVLSVCGKTGLVTLDMADFTETATLKIFTDVERAKLAGIEAGADVTDAGNVGSAIAGSTGKTTPVDADVFAIINSVGSVLAKVTWANIKAVLKTYFDGLYPSGSGTSTGSNSGDQTSIVGITGTKAQFNTAMTDADFATLDGVEILTNKAVDPRVITQADDLTAVIDLTVTDQYQLTAIANATTFSTTGTPSNGRIIWIRWKDAGVAKTLAWDAIFRAIDVTLPTTTVAGKTGYAAGKYNSEDGKVDILAVGVEQ